MIFFLIIKKFDKVSISATTLFVIKFVISSIVILFVFEFIIIVIIIIIVVISFIAIIIKVVIILITFIRELIAFRFDMIIFFIINAIFDELLNDSAIEIKYNAFLKFNNDNMF